MEAPRLLDRVKGFASRGLSAVKHGAMYYVYLLPRKRLRLTRLAR
jgi:hypothetical protein